MRIVDNKAAAFIFTTIDPPDSGGTAPFGINLQGDIVGWYLDAGGVNHGFLLHDGAFSTIDFPGAGLTRVFGINPRRDIVGSYSADANSPPHAFLLRHGGFTTIDPPGATSAFVLGEPSGRCCWQSTTGLRQEAPCRFDFSPY